MLKLLPALLFTLSLVSCSEDNTTTTIPNPTPKAPIETPKITSNLPIPDNRFSDQYNILIFGNSHVSNIGTLIEHMILAENDNVKVTTLTLGGGFLDSESSLKRRTDALLGQSWSHIILQGQKYSQSGRVDYPTYFARAWISQAKEQHIMPILFPEHPQRGNFDEAIRVHNIHKGIVEQQQACIAPVGLTWDRVLSLQPELDLYLSDGNHASSTGAVLTAFVLYESITGNPADLLPYIEILSADEAAQQLFKQIASETMQAFPPCQFN